MDAVRCPLHARRADYDADEGEWICPEPGCDWRAPDTGDLL